jgi:GT2 family glycosyltransferase
MPAITVVLPFRDAERHLTEALDSILSQEFTDFELLALDDGSRDRSRSLVEAAAQRDTRVRLLCPEVRGLPAVLNVGIREAQGRYVARMDGDDIAMPQRFVLQLAALEQDPRLLVVGSAVEQIDSLGRPLETAWYPGNPATIRTILASGRCCLCHPSTMIRRDALVAVGGYRTSVPLTEDFDLWLRLARLGDLRNLGWRLLRYRLHSGSVAFQRTRQQITSLLRSAVLDRNDLEPKDRAFVAICTDLGSLLTRLKAGPDPARVFLELTDWYVDNAAMAGEHRTARRLASQLAVLAPGNDNQWMERRLRQSAALVAAFRHERLAAMRYLLGPGDDPENRAILWRSVFWQPALTLRRQRPPTAVAGPPAGHLDRLGLYEGGHTLLLEGWLPLTGRRLPGHVAVVLPCAARVLSFRLVQRRDVAQAMGSSHLHTGFRLVAALERAVDPVDERPRVWTRAVGRPWRRLDDEAALVDVPAA